MFNLLLFLLYLLYLQERDAADRMEKNSVPSQQYSQDEVLCEREGVRESGSYYFVSTLVRVEGGNRHFKLPIASQM